VSLIVCTSVSQKVLLVQSFWHRKISKDPHILANVNTECPDAKYPELNFSISELNLTSHEYKPAAYVTMHCMIWP
jgi:hypothetical protein